MHSKPQLDRLAQDVVALAGSAGELDREVFREVIGHFMTGVTVITTTSPEGDRGMAASAVSSLSLDPPMMLVCLRSGSTTQGAVSDAGTFCVNVLAEGQEHLASRFARPDVDKFSSVGLRRGFRDLPLLEEALAWLECEVVDEVQGGTHRVLFARVRHAQARPGAPLAYFRGAFGRVQITPDAGVYEAVREATVTRRLPLREPLDTERLAVSLGTTSAKVLHAALKLETEGLLSGTTDRGLTVTPIDCVAADQATDARCALELGAAELTVGRIGDDRLHELRQCMEATGHLGRDLGPAEIAEFVDRDARFHGCMVGLADNAALLQTYERLSLPGIMVRLFVADYAGGAEFIADHEALVQAYEEADLDAARIVIRRHSARAKETNRAAIAVRGGQI